MTTTHIYTLTLTIRVQQRGPHNRPVSFTGRPAQWRVPHLRFNKKDIIILHRDNSAEPQNTAVKVKISTCRPPNASGRPGKPNLGTQIYRIKKSDISDNELMNSSGTNNYFFDLGIMKNMMLTKVKRLHLMKVNSKLLN